ncbi:MAG: 1-acyl-sn-glycerol-3-phosphate acyltransferase [Bacteroidales bacterium]|jgi:1-acyl-sn-glycerol-3-phosphate acyltransferase|nr:1-acyl-sn-glycerol-3-phosphate acyltransferase [Bacteroidales bacterium]
MLSFENINKFNLKYWLLYHYVNFVHNYVYYQRYHVLHKERIPHGEPVVAISNHQNGLTDALGILFAFRKDGRWVIFIARADIFRRKIAAVLLRWLRIMPAFRSIDVSKEKEEEGGLNDNELIFTQSAQVLVEKGVVCLFPEAGHEDCHHLGTFKKGFARIAFKAAELTDFKQRIHIQPMSNHYSNYFGVQNKMVITVGEPFTFEDLYDTYKEHPQRAQKILADRAREKVKALMLDIEDKSLYEEYDIIRNMYDRAYLHKQKKSTLYFPNFLAADQKIVAALDQLRSDDADKFSTLMKYAGEYSRLLDKLYLRDWIFRQKLTFGSFLFHCLLAILVLPFMLYGFVFNALPFYTSTLVTRRIKDQMLHSSFHFVIGALFVFPLWYIALFITAWCQTGTWWMALAFLVTLPISLIIYTHSKIAIGRQFNRFRRFKFWFRGDRFYRRARELRAEIVKIMEQILP